LEPHVAVGEAIMRGVKRLLPYVVGTLCWLLPILLAGSALYGFLLENQTHPSVAAALALLALCVLFAFLAVRLMLSSAVAAAEDIGPIAILQRSWHLSKGNWWRLFVFLVLFGIAALCLILAVESVATLLVRTFAADAGPRSVGGLLISIVSQVVSALLSVFFFVLLARIYAQRSGAGAAQASVPSSGT
jgi:membrane-anchored glycerophosphoryl diester phosphodiesterase (GDPDase)